MWTRGLADSQCGPDRVCAFFRRDSYISVTVARTWSTVISCMQTLSRHAELRLLNALMHGLQVMPAQSGCVRGDGAANSRGVSGPNRTTTSIDVRLAKCAGPLSLVTKTSAIE